MVSPLIIAGVPVTQVFGAVFARLLMGLPNGTAVMLGAILVVSGPTVVGQLLAFIRPTERLQRILSGEGSLMLSVAIGAAGAAGGAVLWFCLCKLNLGDVLATTSQLAVVVGVAAVCDIGRDDAGLLDSDHEAHAIRSATREWRAGPVYPGDTIAARWTVSQVRRSRSCPARGIACLQVTVINQDGTIVQRGSDTYLAAARPADAGQNR